MSLVFVPKSVKINKCNTLPVEILGTPIARRVFVLFQILLHSTIFNVNSCLVQRKFAVTCGMVLWYKSISLMEINKYRPSYMAGLKRLMLSMILYFFMKTRAWYFWDVGRILASYVCHSTSHILVCSSTERLVGTDEVIPLLVSRPALDLCHVRQYRYISANQTGRLIPASSWFYRCSQWLRGLQSK